MSDNSRDLVLSYQLGIDDYVDNEYTYRAYESIPVIIFCHRNVLIPLMMWVLMGKPMMC